jgi:hypothetical protein
LCFPPWRSDIFSLCFLWYIYFTKFHKGVTKFHKG